jgi:hypothetical protein
MTQLSNSLLDNLMFVMSHVSKRIVVELLCLDEMFFAFGSFVKAWSKNQD